MTLASYLVGIAVLGAVAVPPFLGARRIRARLLPDWDGPPAWLVDVVLALAAVLAVSWTLGAVGGFRRALVPLACATAGGVMWLAGRSPQPRATSPRR